jgi:hypothetical protein
MQTCENYQDITNVELTECFNLLIENVNDEVDHLDNQEEELIRFKLMLEGSINDEKDVMVQNEKKKATSVSPKKKTIPIKNIKK